jgi:hypothetical protein
MDDLETPARIDPWLILCTALAGLPQPLYADLKPSAGTGLEDLRGAVMKVRNVASRLALQVVSMAIEGRNCPYFLLQSISFIVFLTIEEFYRWYLFIRIRACILN